MWFKNKKYQQQPSSCSAVIGGSFSSSSLSLPLSPAGSTVSPPSSASAFNSSFGSFSSSALEAKNNSFSSSSSSSSSNVLHSSFLASPMYIIPSTTTTSTENMPKTTPQPFLAPPSVPSKEISVNTNSIPTSFANASLPSLHNHATNASTSHPPKPIFMSERNSSHQSLPTKIPQQHHHYQQHEQQQFRQLQYDQLRADDLFTEMTLNHKRIPPLPPMEIRIPFGGSNTKKNNNNNNSGSVDGSTRSSSQKIFGKLCGGQKQQRYQSTPLKQSGTTTNNNATAAATTNAPMTCTKIGSKMFKGLSTKFNSSVESTPVAVVETVAQEYARTIKALWQMVEEEELAYQIDAAATARLAQQQHYHHRTHLQKQQQQPFNKYTFPMPHEHSSTSFPSRSFNDRNFVHPTALTIDDLELGNISLPVKSGNIADSEDFDSDDEEDFEQKRRELEDLERQVALLGLDDFQDSSDAPDLQSRRSSHHEQYPKLHQQPRLQLQQQQQQKPQQHVLPPIQTTSIQKPPYQRKRQNSLTYEERKIQQSTCRQLSKPSSPVTPIASPISPLRGATVNFFDGIVLDEESSDDNDDSVVLSVAHRVSVRLQDTQGKGGNRNERSAPSWDRARGVSWSPLSKKLSPPTASLPEARLAITTMISAR